MHRVKPGLVFVDLLYWIVEIMLVVLKDVIEVDFEITNRMICV